MSESNKHFDDYKRFSNGLRIWLIAYGIGGPALFLSQETIVQKVIQSGNSKAIVLTFLTGAVLQIVESLVNKWMSWIQYSSRLATEHDVRGAPSETYQGIATKWFGTMWPRLSLDLGSVICFAVATFLAFRALA